MEVMLKVIIKLNPSSPVAIGFPFQVILIFLKSSSFLKAKIPIPILKPNIVDIAQ